jgi:hypothetical protein
LVWIGRFAAVNRQSAERLKLIAGRLLRRRLPFTALELEEALSLAARADAVSGAMLPLRALVLQLEKLAAEQPLERPVMRGLEALISSRAMDLEHAEGRQLATRVERLLGRLPTHGEGIVAGDAWGDGALEEWRGWPAPQRAAWENLWSAPDLPGQPRPTQRWLRHAEQLLQVLDRERLGRQAAAWLRAAAQVARKGGELDALPWSEHNEERLKELAWLLVLVPAEALGAAVEELAEACFRRSGGGGPRAARLGNACVSALGAVGGAVGLSRLAQLKQRVLYPSALKAIERELEQAAAAAGLEAAEVEELMVPTWGLEQGCKATALGPVVVELSVSAGLQVELGWRLPHGPLQKGLSAEWRRRFPAECEELQAEAKDLQSALGAQRERLERLMSARRSWPLGRWRQRYLDHPLVGPLARRLVWQFVSGGRVVTGAWLQGRMVDVCGRPLGLDEGALVSLWHPAEAPAPEAAMWRLWWEWAQLEQPFKQAAREVYGLGGDERPQARHVGRFAGRFLRQHQLAALCQQRGWRYHLQGVFFDQKDVPSRELAEWDLVARLEVAPVLDQALVAESRVCLFVTSGRLGFARLGSGEEVALDEVPPRVLSEVLRDVAFFVAVTDQGEDPTWLETAHDAADLGPLDEEGRARAALVARLLPSLGLHERARVEGAFLCLQGDLNRYRLHLGSGAVLVGDEERPLKLAVDRAEALRRERRRPGMEFDKDRVLGLILSSARLLAQDGQLKDRAWVARLRGQGLPSRSP